MWLFVGAMGTKTVLATRLMLASMIVLKNLSVSPAGGRLLKLTSPSDNSASKPLFSFGFFKRSHEGQCLRWRECWRNTPRLACHQLTQRLLRAFLLFSPL